MIVKNTHKNLFERELIKARVAFYEKVAVQSKLIQLEAGAE